MKILSNVTKLGLILGIFAIGILSLNGCSEEKKSPMQKMKEYQEREDAKPENKRKKIEADIRAIEAKMTTIKNFGGDVKEYEDKIEQLKKELSELK